MAASSSVFSAVRRLPVVVILGATGTGKSKLAIEIGRKLNGEIISADAMQLYQGLDIITNKVTQEEQDQCPHHTIGYVDPHSFYTVTDFRNKALPIIDGLLQRGKLPIIVGGTNYYIEALLWNILIGEEKEKDTLVWEERPLKRLKIKKRNQTAQQSQSSSSVGATHSSGNTHEYAVDRISDVQYEQDSHKSKDNDSCIPGDDSDGCKVTSGEEAAAVQDLEAKVSRNGSGTRRDQVDLVEGASNYSKTDTRLHAVQNDSNTSIRNTDQTDGIEEYHKDHLVCHESKPESSSTLSSCEETTLSSSYEGPEHYEELDIEATDSATLHQILADIDPQRADGLHPNDRRKIIRSLQVYEQQGITHSELLSRQHERTGGSTLSGPLRYPNLCILWLQADMEVFRQRLDKRVDDMMARGLVEELAGFHEQHNQQRLQSSDTRKEEQYVNGIFQSIGFKEFHKYLILPDHEKATDEGVKLLQEGVERMKIATRQYAKKQNKWVRNRFIKRPGYTAPAVYSLDTTDPSKWDEVVLLPALSILDHLLQSKKPPVEPVHPKQFAQEEEDVGKHATFVCDVCQGKRIVGWQQWQGHLKSRTHAKRKRKAMIRNWEWQQTKKQKNKEKGNQATK